MIADYRGFITLRPEDARVDPDNGATELLLKYDATDGTDFVPVPWCDNPQFNGDGEVTDGRHAGWRHLVHRQRVDRRRGHQSVVTTWQVFGQDDPKFQ